MKSDDFGLSRAVSLENSDCEERREEVETVVREPIGKLSLSGEISCLYNISLVSPVICVHKNVSQCHYSLITEYQPTPTQGSRCHHSHREGRSLSPLSPIICILPSAEGSVSLSKLYLSVDNDDDDDVDEGLR